MCKKNLSVKSYRPHALLLAMGLVFSSVTFNGAFAASPTLPEAQAQARVWQNEIARISRTGDSTALATARTELRNWEAIVAQLEKQAKEQALLEEARKNAGKAEQIAKLRNMQVPAGLSGEQRTLFILRQDQRMAEQEKTAKERALQDQLRGQLRLAITSGDYNRAKGFVNQGAKADAELIQQAVDGGYTGIAYLLIKSNDKLLRSDIDRVLGKGMLKAAQLGSPERINNLVKLGADVNYSEGDVSPLALAARGGHMAALNALVAQGARRDPQAMGQLLFQAAQRGDQNSVASLIRMGASADYAKDGATPLSTALEAGNYGLATILINGGARADERILGRALFRATEQGAIDSVTQLLKMKANVNYVVNGKTPLTVALERQNMALANVLIGSGGDEPSGQFGKKLFDAALANDMAWVGTLSKIKKYRDYRNFQRETPLHAAASRGHVEAINALLSAGANPNALTIKNWSPLHHAARFAHKMALIHLLKGGADVHAVNSDGYDAYQLAAVAMRNSKNELDTGGILDYIRVWRQHHPRQSASTASNSGG